MAITGNKGEWSETYAFLRMLADGKLIAADDQKNQIDNEFSPIIRIFREQHEYFPDLPAEAINIFYNGSRVLSVPTSEIAHEATTLFSEIIDSNTGEGSFSIPTTETFIQKIYITKLKAPSSDKSNINIEIYDSHTGHQKVVGFIIENNISAPPALLNSSITTNVIFEVKGINPSEIPKINSIDTHKKIIDRMAEIEKKGGKLYFEKVDNEIFKDNLMMIDSQMPIIVAGMLKGFYCEHIKECLQLAEYISCINPLNRSKEFYFHKFRELLCAVALGMKPATKWDGNDEANGGYIVVKDDGNVVAIHIYNRNFFKNYLLLNTQLVQPSTTRYGYCSLYEENGKIFIKLNLQIRFI